MGGTRFEIERPFGSHDLELDIIPILCLVYLELKSRDFNGMA